MGIALCSIPAFASCPSPSEAPTSSNRYLLNVQDFGAIGDGVRDDRPAIQNALNCAQQLGYATVMFQSKTYRLVSSTDASSQLHISSWYSSHSVRLIGTGTTVITTEQVNSILLLFDGSWKDGLVDGINFRNNHPLTTLATVGIGIAGGGGNTVLRPIIQHCTFENFSRHIAICGVSTALIQSNRFLMDLGRDSGTSLNETDPNVAIWLFNNFPNGTTVDVEIANNFYDGCTSGTLVGRASPLCGDGLVFGQANHANIHNNHIQRFSFEGIQLQPNFGPGSGKVPSVISDNTIDATKVTGDKNGGGLWGIRCDEDGVLIAGNTITNAVDAVLVYGTNPQHPVSNTIVKGNNIYLSGLSNPSPVGIYMGGVSNPTIDSNLIIFPQNTVTNGPETPAVYISGMGPVNPSVAPNVTNNNIMAYGGMSSGRTTAIYLQWTSQLNIAHNNIHGLSQVFHFLNYGAALPPVASLIQSNTLTSNLATYIRTN